MIRAPDSTARFPRALPLGLIVIAAGLAGCSARTMREPPAEPSGAVDYQLLAPADEGRHAFSRGQAASGGAPLDSQAVLPEYPPDWLVRRLPSIAADALVVVDEAGQPARIEVDGEALRSQCGDCSAAFSGAVEAALRRWRFAPLEVADWIDGPDEDGDGEPDSVQRAVVATRPYSLRLRFAFSVRDGEAFVSRLPAGDN